MNAIAGDKEYLTILDELGPGCAKVIKELRELHVKKSADYGTDEDALANLRGSEDIGLPAWKGAWVRAKDKVFRMDSFCRNGRLENEGVEDTLKDLASYCCIVLKLFREEME
jgi:hypothetical protein